MPAGSWPPPSTLTSASDDTSSEGEVQMPGGTTVEQAATRGGLAGSVGVLGVTTEGLVAAGTGEGLAVDPETGGGVD